MKLASFIKKPRTRPKLMVGKKSWRSTLKTYLLLMPLRVSNDRFLAFEAVSHVIFSLLAFVYLFDAVLQQIRQTTLQEPQISRWSAYLANTSASLSDFK